MTFHGISRCGLSFEKSEIPHQSERDVYLRIFLRSIHFYFCRPSENKFARKFMSRKLKLSCRSNDWGPNRSPTLNKLRSNFDQTSFLSSASSPSIESQTNSKFTFQSKLNISKFCSCFASFHEPCQTTKKKHRWIKLNS